MLKPKTYNACPKLTSRLHKAACLSNQVYMSPKSYIWNNPHSQHLHSKDIDLFITPSWKEENDSVVYVVFRGACGVKDILIGAEAMVTPQHISVHNGYLKRYIPMHQEVVETIKHISSIHKPTDIVWTGHSMGGAYAAISCLVSSLFSELDSKHLVCYTFGSPKCISGKAYNYFNKTIDHLGIEHIYDPIPQIPLHPDLETLPNKLIIGGSRNEVAVDVVKNHMSSLYRQCLEDVSRRCGFEEKICDDI